MTPDDHWQRLYEAKRRLKADLLAGVDADATTYASDIPPNPIASDDWEEQMLACIEDSPLVVFGQGDFKRVYTGDDFGGTGFFPLRKAPLRSKRAALSFLKASFFGRVSVVRWLRAALSLFGVRR